MSETTPNPLSTGNWGPFLSTMAINYREVEQIAVFNRSGVVWGIGYGEKVDQKNVVSEPFDAANLRDFVSMDGAKAVVLGSKKFIAMGTDEDEEHDNIYKFRGNGYSLVAYRPDEGCQWGMILKSYKEVPIAAVIGVIEKIKMELGKNPSQCYKVKK